MSFLFRLRKVLHTTPILREVSQGFANSFGMGKAYSEFDGKIGYTADGQPVPQSSERGTVGFGRDDLADWASEQFPNTAALVNQYRSSQRSIDRLRPARTPAPYEGDEDDLGDELVDQGDDEEDF